MTESGAKPPVQQGSARSWSTATWAVPFTTQGVLALLFLCLWLLGKLFPEHERAWFLSATVATTVVSAAIGVALSGLASSRARGAASALVGSAVIVFVAGVAYSEWVLR